MPEWTPQREAAHDWRILYLDAYAAHFADEVADVAWRRGFVVLWHGAGTTGLLQVNDTHLHAKLERDYLNMQALTFAEQQYFDPTDISRSRADVACDVAGTWDHLDHRQVAVGHKNNGLNTSLRGGEDHFLSAAVREVWDAVEGARLRDQIGEEIGEKVASGEYQWSRETIRLLSGRDAAERHLGAYAQEGRELEAAQQEGEPVFEDAPANETDEEKDDRQRARVAGSKAAAEAATGLAPHTIGGKVVPAKESDTEAAKERAEKFAQKKQILEELRENAIHTWTTAGEVPMD